MRRRAAIVALAAGITSGCSGSFLSGALGIPGSGVAKDETRPVDTFHALDVGSVIQVSVAVTHRAKPSLKISGDDNLVPLIESVIQDGTLILRVKDNSNITPKLPLVADVVTGELDRVEASGAASVTVKGGSKVEQFTANASGAARVSVEGLESAKAIAGANGASHVVLSGSAASLKVEASGASEVKADALKVEDADVNISGASSASLRANTSVTGDVSGASRLDLHGQPARQTVSISGASSVNGKN